MSQAGIAMDLSKLENFIFDKISKTKLPGVSAAIVRNGQVTWAKAFGFRDLERGLAATPLSLFGIGSVTKSFTAIAIMQLAEKGGLALDDPVEKHIPFKLRPRGEPIRIWHLLTHTSGIPALAYAEAVIRGVTGGGEKWLPIAGYSDMLTFLNDASEWALWKPGERWFYLNEGYILLGMIVAKCSGLDYADYIRKFIFEPLGMTRSYFSKADAEHDTDFATPYIVTDDGERRPSTYAYGSILSDGGIISNVLDLARYVCMYLNQGEYDGNRILYKESIADMFTPRITTPHTGRPIGDYQYALGLAVYDSFFGHKLISHGGSVGTATAYIGMTPDSNVGIALLANGSGYALSQLGMYGLALVLGMNADQLYFVARERALDELEGTYEAYKGTIRWSVRRSGEFLTIEEETKFNTTTTILVPDEIGETVRTFYTLEPGNRLAAEFRIEDEKISLVTERYFLRRTGKLP